MASSRVDGRPTLAVLPFATVGSGEDQTNLAQGLTLDLITGETAPHGDPAESGRRVLYFLLLGRAYFFLGDWEQALVNLNEALARNPSNLEAHLYLMATAQGSECRYRSSTVTARSTDWKGASPWL